MQQVRAIRLGDPCVVSLKFEQRSNYISKSSIPRAQATRHSSFGIGVRERSTQNRLRVRASEENKGNNSGGIDALSEGEVAPKAAQKGQSKGVNLFDPAATLSRAVTRRFGLAGGLAFVALLASTEGYEIIKALLERDEEGDFEPMETDSGLIYKDSKVWSDSKLNLILNCLKQGCATRRSASEDTATLRFPCTPFCQASELNVVSFVCRIILHTCWGTHIRDQGLG